MNDTDAAELSQAKRALLAQRLRGRTLVPRPSSSAKHASGNFPLSVDQEALWYFSRLAPTNPVYNESVTIRKDGPFDVGAFRRAFNEFVRRHEAWRTTFSTVRGEPTQVVNPPTAFELPVLDLSQLRSDEAERHASQMAADEAQRPYDLERGPLLRPRLVRFAESQHRLYLAMHHLVFDGVTLSRVLLPELVALYDAFAAGQPSPLPEPVLQYSEYVEWERDWMSGTVASRRMEYWKAHLDGAPMLELPLSHTRPTVPRFRGQMEGITVDAKLASEVRSLARECGVTLFQVLATCFGILLSRYSGQQDVVFGTVTDMRQRPELSSLVGYSLTPLVLRLDVAGEPTVEDLLSRFRSTLLGALDNLIPFTTLVREIHPERQHGSNPLFQAMIELQPPMASVDSCWSVHLMEVEIGNAIGHAKLDLDLELDERPGGHISGRLIFDTDVIESDTAKRMVGHFLTLLEAMTSDPRRSVSALSLLGERERQKVLLDWNDTEADYPDESCLHKLVAARAKSNPHDVAVVFEGASLSYAELDHRANGVAHRLSAIGAQAGTVVGFHAEPSLEMVVGLLGILKSGAAYLPLDPSNPANRHSFMMEDCGVRILLTDGRVPSSLSSHLTNVITVELSSASELREDPPPAVATADDPMYVLYTSGSTGKPKAVSICHRSVINLLTAAARQFSLGSADTVGAVASSSFDMSVLDFWLPLVTGARLCLVPRDVVLDAPRLGRLITAAGITFQQATPSIWQMIVDAGWTGSRALTIVSCGEPLTPQLATTLNARCAALWNAYGPTEATVWTTLGQVQNEGPITVGTPIANTRVYILDDRGEPEPIGIPGEIFIGGTGVAEGYLNRPDETDYHFVPDKFVPGGRLYRSGDIGRLLSDGRIEHLGRIDQQIKHHGHRIEPAEIEAALRRHQNVGAAVVTTCDHPPGRSILVAYVVPTGPAPAASELRRLLRTTLPDYMVPSAFVVVDRIPYTANGKLDRLSLPAPTVGGGFEPRVSPPPSELEARLLGIWRGMLGIEDLGVEDDFFEMGGDSLLAWRLVVAAGQSLGVELPLVVLFECESTVRGMAASIRAHDPTSPEGPPVALAAPKVKSQTLFYIVPHEAALMALRHIVSSPRDDCEVVGLLSGRLGERFDRSASVESLASEALAEIRDRQPHGPYCIAGFSIGGLVAYEVAGMLRSEGEVIVWLGLVDAVEPSQVTGGRVLAKIAQRRSHHLRGVMVVLRSWFSRHLFWLHPLPSDQFDLIGVVKTARRYAVVGHDAPLVAILSERTAAVYGSSGGWDKIHKGTLVVHAVPGDHVSGLKAAHAIIAKVLSERSQQISGDDREAAT